MTTPDSLHEQELRPGILRWVIDNPQRGNAIAPAVFDWIAQRCSQLHGEVVLLRGAGDRVFSAGFDLKALAEQSGRVEGASWSPDAPLIAATAAMQAADATFVAVINGVVIGAGVELISACDLRLARTGASLRLPAGRLGVVYHAAGLTRIHAALGSTVLRRLLLAGEEVPIEDAIESLAALVDLDELDDDALALGERIAHQSRGPDHAPSSLAANRRLLRALDQTRPLPADLLASHEQARMAAYSALSFATVDSTSTADPGPTRS